MPGLRQGLPRGDRRVSLVQQHAWPRRLRQAGAALLKANIVAGDHAEETLPLAELHHQRQKIGPVLGCLRYINTRVLLETSKAPKFLMPAGICDVWHRQIIAAHLNAAAISAKHSERLGPRMPHAACLGHSPFRTAWRWQLHLTPLELTARIAPLVPPPRTHRHRFFGVLARKRALPSSK